MPSLNCHAGDKDAVSVRNGLDIWRASFDDFMICAFRVNDKKKTRHTKVCRVCLGEDEWTRTTDPLHVKQIL